MNTKEIIFDLMDDYTKGVDTYNHNGSTWLIFTDSKKWVIELTKEKTLWYNYYFFTGVFKYLSLDVVENQHYITKWVEDNVINGVKDARALEEWVNSEKIVDKTIQNGVKDISHSTFNQQRAVEDTIQNGVINIAVAGNKNRLGVKDTIQNGVKETNHVDVMKFFDNKMDDVLQNGVKHTEKSLQIDGSCVIEDTIQNGVKKTKRSYEGSRKQRTKDTIQNGVKVTYSDKIPHQYDWTNQFTDEIEDIIKNGVKHTEYGDWEDGDERLDDIIKNGIKETKSEVATREWKAGEVINGGIRKTEGGVLFDESKIDTVISEGIKETYDDVMPHTGRVEGVIKNSVKKTVDALSSRLPNPVGDVIKNGVKQCIPSHTPLYNPMDFSVVYRENLRIDDVTSVLEKGIKEVQPLPSQEGNKDWGDYYHRQEDRTKPHTKYVDDVILNGIKETVTGSDKRMLVENVLNNGIKLT